MICCVRNPAWVMDSFELLVRKNAFDVSRIFNSAQERSTVYTRADALLPDAQAWRSAIHRIAFLQSV